MSRRSSPKPAGERSPSGSARRPRSGSASASRQSSEKSSVARSRGGRVPEVERPLAGRLVFGDCLDELPKLRTHYPEGFDLVYVDPPFNAGGVRSAREGRGHRVHGAHAYKDAWGGIRSFLAMLKPRLSAIRDAMNARGSLWLHLDHRTVHDAKVLADEVFGNTGFEGEIIWVPGNGGRRRSGPRVA